MKKQEAEKLINDTFTHAYSEEQFRLFIRNLFQDLEELSEKALAGQYIPEAFREGVVSYKRLAKFSDPEGLELDVLAVKLPSRRTLENARTMQRNFIARYLNGNRGGALKDAALVAFYSDDAEDWRFSLVRMDYVLDEEQNKIRKDLTPARRYSFLVGRSEKTHTARRQLFPILESETETTLTELEIAFNIETVTREFFEQYKGLYLRLKEALDKHLAKDAVTRTEFESKGVKTPDFAKRLLGQIVFLYFLQKKGWLGVARGKAWGTGSKDFLQKLYHKKLTEYQNFFNDILEPLFYEALATERTDNFYQRFDCRIPFLNGGLFEPIRGYDWVNTDILLDNAIFGEVFGVFDLYNFTVREDEPLDKEVAVDPEMLGKVFENLIPENERKGSGTYYTPREIVHYMCQESLINYLDAKLNIEQQPVDEQPQRSFLPDPRKVNLFTKYEAIYVEKVSREDIAEFIHNGDVAQEHDATAGVKTQNVNYKGDYQYRISESIRNYAKEIDNALASVKICDPAIGSGAFPVGVMNEIVRARLALNSYLGTVDRSSYEFKRHAIQESIYGVDIESSAVDIAKLRLWLSLVVDEEDFGTIQPLPNLDYKIVSGNSLFGFPFDTGARSEKLRKLTPLKEQFFDTYSPSKKLNLRNKINEIINSEYNNPQTEKSIGYKVDFDFRWSFFEVFDRQNGFDIVIANPPYVSHDRIENKTTLKDGYKCYEPFADLYCYFIEIATRLLSEIGTLTYITSNSYLRADYGTPLRSIIYNTTHVRALINLDKIQVFDSAIVNTAILIVSKAEANVDSLIVNAEMKTSNVLEFINKNKFFYKKKDFNTKSWTLISADQLKLQRRLEAHGIQLNKLNTKIRLGIATGSNEAFLLSEEKAAVLIGKNSKNKEIIKPVLRGREIQRFYYEKPSQYLLLTRNEINVPKDYPDILEYLETFGEKFKNRGAKGRHWTNLRACAFFDDFKLPKIIWIELTDRGRFALCKEEIYLINSAYFLLIPERFIPEYLLGVLNSKAINFYLKTTAETSGMGTARWINNYVQEFPIPSISKENQRPIVECVNKISALKRQNPAADVSALEKALDQQVYQLYELTSEEIAIIENEITPAR